MAFFNHACAAGSAGNTVAAAASTFASTQRRAERERAADQRLVRDDEALDRIDGRRQLQRRRGGCRRSRHTGGRVREIEKLADVADERRDPRVRRTGRRERRQQVDLRWHPVAVASS